MDSTFVDTLAMSAGSYPPMQQGVSKIYCAHLRASRWCPPQLLASGLVCMPVRPGCACLVRSFSRRTRWRRPQQPYIHGSIAEIVCTSLRQIALCFGGVFSVCLHYTHFLSYDAVQLRNFNPCYFPGRLSLTRCFRYSTPLTSRATLTVAELGESFFNFPLNFISLLWPYLCANRWITERILH